MYEKIYALLNVWENEWQDLQDKIALESCEPDSDLHVAFLKTKADKLESCMEELRKIVSE